jgi:hypothetical protein
VTELLAWVWLPVVLYVLALGAGLLTERLAGHRLPNALVAPVGLAVLLVAITPIYRLGGGSAIAAPVAVLAALVGLFMARRSLRGRLNPGAAGLAGLGAYLLYLAPVAASGHWTWSGYEFVNDTASNLVFAAWVGENGVTEPSAVDSTTSALATTPIQLKYPLAAHFLLATVEPLSGAPLAAVYHPLLSAFAGFAAMSLTHLARRAGLPGAAAAGAGFVAVAANLLYRYLLHGGIKEALVVALLGTAAAVGYEALRKGAAPRLVAILAVVVAPLPAVYSATGSLYGVALAGVLALAALLQPQRIGARRLATAGTVGIVVALLAALPTLADTVSFGRQASETFASSGGNTTAYFGQLVRPLPLEQAAGVWLGRDYRLPVEPEFATENAVLIGVILVFALLGVIFELRSRRPAGLLLLAATGAVAVLLAPRLSPYADGKLLVVLGPAIVLVSASGVYALGRGGRPRVAAAAVAALAIAGGVLSSAAVAYREAQLAPPKKVAAMEDAAEHATGGGLWLVNEWEEYSKYFMRSVRVNAAFEAESPRPAQLRDPQSPLFGHYYDLDAERLSYVLSFPGIIKRRSPDSSRPPANFEMVYRNDYYEVWRQRGGVRVREHLPLQRLHHPVDVARCESVRRLASRARPGEQLVAARRPAPVQLDTARAERSPGWVRHEGVDGTITPSSPGFARGSATAPTGRYEVWLRGTFGRPVSAWIDGRRLGAVEEINTRGQWLRVGTVDLRGGRHELEIRRGGRSLAPGNAYRGLIGPLALDKVGGRKLVSVPPQRAAELCGKRWDWIELTRG